MKRLFILMSAVALSIATTFASETVFISKLNNRQGIREVANVTSADVEQRIALSEIFELSSQRLEDVQKDLLKGKASDEDLRKVVYFNLANVKAVLSPDQYRAYLRFINTIIIEDNIEKGVMYAEK